MCKVEGKGPAGQEGWVRGGGVVDRYRNIRWLSVFFGGCERAAGASGSNPDNFLRCICSLQNVPPGLFDL